MGIGAIFEPLIVVSLLFGGAWINRTTGRYPYYQNAGRSPLVDEKTNHGISEDQQRPPPSMQHRSISPCLLSSQEQHWQQRGISFLGLSGTVETPNTAIFRHRLLSRLLARFPFLVEAFYWGLIYWIYQLGRAFTALTIEEGTVHVARKHALQLIELEQRLHIFWEVPIQQFFMQFPVLMRYINWLYSFIHIPGTIAFLVWLYYYTITRNRIQLNHDVAQTELRESPSGPGLYESRRRTMAVCNLMAFVVFTLWPCMPPRLLSDQTVDGQIGDLARSFGFVDTVHGADGAVSVWTANKFCNQWAAMPSLHFGYSLLVGVTIMSVPLAPELRRSKSIQMPFFNQSHPHLAPKIRLPSTRRLLCIGLGFFYPFAILVAIISTANHFILDAVAGAFVCAIGWNVNDVLLNLLPVEDWFLWYLRVHKPEIEASEGQTQYSWRPDDNEKVQHGVLNEAQGF